MPLPPFVPYFRNPHLQTVLSAFWKRRMDEARHPVESLFHETEPGVRVQWLTQRPAASARAQLVLVHGLTGSAASGYVLSLARTALEHGWSVHRINMRGAGGTERASVTVYHAGLTLDLHRILPGLAGGPPIFLVGYSLGGNVVLKLAGELGAAARGLLAGVAAVSTPLDLAACVDCLNRRVNRVYQRHFVEQLKRAIRVRHAFAPERFPIHGLDEVRTVREFDDRFVAPPFGFGSAARYYETQSAARFLDAIAIPTLLIHAQDDPLVPFEAYRHPAFLGNAHLELLAPEHGGHNAFLSRRGPRYWSDWVIARWVERLLG